MAGYQRFAPSVSAMRQINFSLPEDKDYPEGLLVRLYDACQAAVKLLGKKAGIPLKLHNPINPHLHWTVTLYSNYTIPARILTEEDETDVVMTILEELELPEDRYALWHYDCFNGEVETRLKPWKAPSDKFKRELKKLYDDLGREYNL